MITQAQIDNFIEKIPPSPDVLKQTMLLLNAGELTRAAKVAVEDKALNAYLKDLVNKPIFGFRQEVSDTSQIFGILGLSGSQQAVYNYMISLLSPAKWSLFKLNKKLFYNLQAQLSGEWKIILKKLQIDDKEIESAISLLPASIIVADALFGEKIDDVNLLRSASNIDYNTILERLCGKDLFDICEQIAKKWDMNPKVYQIVQAASGTKSYNDKELMKLGKWMHLLLFYTLSKPEFIDAELNDFIEFQVDFVNDIYNNFLKVVEVEQ
ncbi:HDOD domain-containing protein [Sulfurimonas sp. C5]|uniref:HDOD domain-containing protein n=1 Tax=Sulfurimonas sp. C5 TaxID=3036947 RepID=UPI002456160C|nr:HDOD domain-containing protein [Sulfurimonas sp. C5]MDH4945005.1 HDOD domain-containing protein [Sulfurimonas sp. C5]